MTVDFGLDYGTAIRAIGSELAKAFPAMLLLYFIVFILRKGAQFVGLLSKR